MEPLFFSNGFLDIFSRFCCRGRKEGRKEGRREGGKEGRREGGRKGGRKEASKRGREEGRKGRRSNVSVPGCSLYFVFAGEALRSPPHPLPLFFFN